MKRMGLARRAAKRILAFTLTGLCLIAACPARAGAENPLGKEGVKICLLDDFKHYEDVNDAAKGSLSRGDKDKLIYENGTLKICADAFGSWQDMRFATFGLSQRGKLPNAPDSFTAGSFTGAQGIGVRVKIESMGTFNISFLGKQNGEECFFQPKPDAPYYVIAKDGVTNKAMTIDTGYGFGTMGTLPARENFDCLLLIPFSSLQDSSTGAGFEPENSNITHMFYKTYGGTPDTGIVLYSLFLYGTDVIPFGEDEVNSFFTEPDKVTSPTNYSVPKEILEKRKQGSQNSTLLKIILLAIGALSLGGAVAFAIISGKKNQTLRAETKNGWKNDNPKE